MLTSDLSRPTVAARRRARDLAYRNGGLWAIGNGLCSTMLVVYVAMEFDVSGVGLGISLAGLYEKIKRYGLS